MTKEMRFSTSTTTISIFTTSDMTKQRS